VLPSNLDIQYETFKPGDALYFFAFDKKNSFQLTLKEKTNGCFFVIKIKIQEEIFENCGFLDKELDGSYRGRYIHISKLEDCKRWRIVILCKLGNSCTTENRFARINLLWQCLQQPAGVHDGVWSQWGVLHAEVISPGVDKEFLYLRGVRGKHTGESSK